MKLTTFEKQIGTAILSKGRAYYNNGNVSVLEEMEPGIWTAQVYGSDDYSVEVVIGKKGGVEGYDCDCPYDGDLCKHVIAVLYSIRETTTIQIKAGNGTDSKKEKKKLSFADLLSKIDVDELKEFIVQYAKKDKDFKTVFELSFADKDVDFDLEGKIRKRIRMVVMEESSYEGYFGYQEGKKLAKEFEVILKMGKGLLNQNRYSDACTYAFVLIDEIIKVIPHTDDSNGYLEGCMYEVVSFLEDIAMVSPRELQNKIFEFLGRELKNADYFDYGDLGYEVLNVYRKLSESLGEHEGYLKFLEEALAAKNIGDYRKEFLIGLKVSVLKAMGREAEVDQVLQDQIHLPKFREQKVQELIAKKDYSRAKKLLKEGVSLAEEKKHAGTVGQWERFLVEIARLENDIGTVRNYLEKFAFGNFIDMQYYRQWKATYSSEEWEQVIQKKIEAIKQKIQKNKQLLRFTTKESMELNTLGEVYVEERLFDRLIMLVQYAKTLNAVLKYQPYLCEEYAKELIQVYSSLLEKEAERASDRTAYQQLIKNVQRIARGIPSGKEQLVSIMLNWKELYKRRPAMVDEINKAIAKI